MKRGEGVAMTLLCGFSLLPPGVGGRGELRRHTHRVRVRGHDARGARRQAGPVPAGAVCQVSTRIVRVEGTTR